jgi:hypothetical protein
MMKFLVSVLFLVLAAFTLAAGCGNPYFPARPGSSKTFTFTGGSTGSYTIRVVNVTANGFTLRYEYTNPVRVLESPFTCTPEGLTSPSLFGSGFGPDANITTQVKASSGILIPAEGRWKVGSSWIFSNEGTLTANDKTQGQLVYTFKNEFTFQIVAQEQVKVPAGTFQAFKVVLTQQGQFGAKGTSYPVNYRITQWYAKGVGLVRQEDQHTVHELIKYAP